MTSEDKASLAERIRRYALDTLGFSAIGFAKADKVSEDVAENLKRWLDEGKNADMAYLANWYEKRIDPRLLMPGLKTIVSVALNYAPAHTLPEGEPQISAYALGKDYHDIVKGKLFKLAEMSQESERSPLVPANFRVFVDTGPVLERYWAVQAGLGWIGKNHQLIIPHAGSMFFLGELFLDIELPYDKPMKSFCGNCHRCIDACPTGALGNDSLNNDSLNDATLNDASLKNKEKRIKNTESTPNSEDCNHNVQCSMFNVQSEFDASKCLSYQLIENRGELSEQAKKAMGDMFYGCDRCQTACPWNRFAKPNTTPELQPSEDLLHMTREQWHHLTVEEYRKLFKGSAVKRAKYDGLMRNIDNLK